MEETSDRIASTRRGVNQLVIDTDPGVDDADAIMMAFAHPGRRSRRSRFSRHPVHHSGL